MFVKQPLALAGSALSEVFILVIMLFLSLPSVQTYIWLSNKAPQWAHHHCLTPRGVTVSRIVVGEQEQGVALPYTMVKTGFSL